MRTGEIVDLTNERRLSAVLDFSSGGGELLILNGGSRAEEFVVFTDYRGDIRAAQRSAYCIDSGTSMQIAVDFGPANVADEISLRIVGGHGEMVLASAQALTARRIGKLRGWSSVVAAILLLQLAGGRLETPAVFATADPEPAAAEAPLIKASVSLAPPMSLPNVIAQSAVPHKEPAAGFLRPPVTRLVDRRVASAVFIPAAPRHSVLPETPAPRMTDLRVPSTAKSGDFIPVSFGAVAHQVKIVASIGPTIVSKTIVGTQRGVIAIRSPKSDLDSRVMTVRAYAQNGNRTSSLQAMVVLVRP